MNNKVKNLDLKNRTYYFLNYMINAKKFDVNKIKIDKNSYKNVLIYYIRYVTIKDSKYIKIHGINPLYLIYNQVN